MPGLLDALSGNWTDDQNQNTAVRQGLLGAVFGAMAGRGTTMQALGQGGLAGLQGYTNSLEQQQQDAARKLQTQAAQQQLQLGGIQLQQAKRQATRLEQIDALAPLFARTPEQQALAGGGGPTVANAGRIGTTAPGFDWAGYSQALAGIDPTQAVTLQAALAKDTPFNKIDPKDYTPESLRAFSASRSAADLVPVRKMEVAPNGQAFNPWAVQPGQVFNDPNKAFSIGANGQPVANTGFQQFELSKARSGATQLSVNTAPKAFWGDLGGGISKQFLEGRDAAQGAATGLQALNEAKQLLDSGVITGFAADGRLQVSKALGIDPQRVANTEAFVGTMGRQTLGLVKQLGAGSGISNADRDFAEKVAGGSIQLNEGSIRRLMDINQRASTELIARHNRQAEAVMRSPDAAGLPFDLRVTMPQIAPSGPRRSPAAPAGGGGVINFGDLR